MIYDGLILLSPFLYRDSQRHYSCSIKHKIHYLYCIIYDLFPQNVDLIALCLKCNKTQQLQWR